MLSFVEFIESNIKVLEETADTLTFLINYTEEPTEVMDFIYERQKLENKVVILKAALNQRGQA